VGGKDLRIYDLLVCLLFFFSPFHPSVTYVRSICPIHFVQKKKENKTKNFLFLPFRLAPPPTPRFVPFPSSYIIPFCDHLASLVKKIRKKIKSRNIFFFFMIPCICHYQVKPGGGSNM